MQPSAPISDLKQVTCPNCGASLSYAPGTTGMTCEHCRSAFEIKVEQTALAGAHQENDLATALQKGWQATGAQDQVFVVKCPACGAESAMEKNLFAAECSFCASPLTVTPDMRSVAHPQGVLPFKLAKESAAADFDKWLRRLWFAPNDLKKLASADRFNGLYLPFWTFDAATQTDYRGERGDHYTETRTRVVDGKTVTERVVKTRWSPAGGRVARFFNDLLVTASRALPEQYLARLEPWDLPNLVPYDARYLSGFKAEISQLDIASGFELAKQNMDVVIAGDIRRDIGGDEQRIHQRNTQYSRTTYKYILLPVWLSVYRYGGKVYRFVVNARTGEVHGERPYSPWKIALAVIAGLILLGVLISVFGSGQ